MTGNRIRKRRIELKLTQDELAKQAGISKGFLSEIENNKKSVSAENLFSIARVLNCTIDSLMSETQEYQSDKQIDIEIPPELSQLALKEELPFNKVVVLLNMRKQIIAHRSVNSTSQEFDWLNFIMM